MHHRTTHDDDMPLQQYLPFTVLKLQQYFYLTNPYHNVATVLTVYGIETNTPYLHILLDVATVLTVYGIEMFRHNRYRYQ